MPQVQVIQPIQQQPKRLRVAAYARVSSDSTDQLNSLSVQVDYYTHLIQENPNWDFAGIYADEGITGTSTKHREQFNRLLDDCRAGLIDRVLVKSASRFARNTADALASVREMKSLGVTVVFEKEGFDTETANGEMILSMICAAAQEESLSISQNTKWGIRKKMHDGTYITSLTPFGYKKIDRQLFPDEKEAATVKEIFNLFLNGFSTAEIANHLNTNHPKPDVIWRSASVRFILRNEKYIGDSLFQKNYTPDINTSTMNSEMILTVLSAFAQAESESISQNVARGKRMGFRQGKFPFPYRQILGYRKGSDGKPEIIPEEAEVIRMIFNSYLQGASLQTIKKRLEADDVLTARGNKKWSSESVQRILQNEKYCGDVLLQKTFIEDVLTGVSKKNTGQLPQYYIENNHEGIVTKQTFREAQAEIARRNSKSATNHRKRHRGRYNSKYALSERLVCGDCGSSYKRVTWSIHGRKQIVWRCVNRLEYGTKFCSNSPSIPETELHQAILKAVQNLAAKFTGEVADQLNGILHQIEVGESLTPQLQAQLEQNQQEFDHLLEMSLDFDENTPFLDDKLKRLSDKIKQLKTAITQSSVNSQTPSTPTNPITAKDLLITEYDDMLTARIIEKIIVKSRQDLEIIFIGGYTQQISLQ